MRAFPPHTLPAGLCPAPALAVWQRGQELLAPLRGECIPCHSVKGQGVVFWLRQNLHPQACPLDFIPAPPIRCIIDKFSEKLYNTSRQNAMIPTLGK